MATYPHKIQRNKVKSYLSGFANLLPWNQVFVQWIYPKETKTVDKPPASFSFSSFFLHLKFGANSEGYLNDVDTCPCGWAFSPISSFLRELSGEWWDGLPGKSIIMISRGRAKRWLRNHGWEVEPCSQLVSETNRCQRCHGMNLRTDVPGHRANYIIHSHYAGHRNRCFATMGS